MIQIYVSCLLLNFKLYCGFHHELTFARNLLAMILTSAVTKRCSKQLDIHLLTMCQKLLYQCILDCHLRVKNFKIWDLVGHGFTVERKISPEITDIVSK